MKRILLLSLIGLFSNILFAQDIIVRHNGDEIQSKIIEISSDLIKYKKFDFQDGPTRNINISEVFMIIYENGEREKFSTPANAPSEEISNNEEDTNNDEYDGKYFMVGIGYGNSYGGSGVRLQWRMGGVQGVGIHLGAGYFENAPVLASAGFKFFPYKAFYLNAQFGLTGWEEYYYWNSSGYSYDESHLLYGPSFLVGGDWVWGDKVGIGFNVGAGATYNINAEYFDPITMALDIGFLIRF